MFKSNFIVLYLTADQVEILLMKIKNHPGEYHDWVHPIEMLLAQNCVDPWSVDVQLARSGVYYHGNFGETPTLKNSIGILSRSLRRFVSSLQQKELVFL